MTDHRLPTYFISHGGGPWPWIKDLMPGDWEPLERSLRAIPLQVGAAPRAILAVSAHWEEPVFTVQTSPNPPMLYDYGGFPEFTYHLQYPAPGTPDVAEEVVELLGDAGFEVGRDPHRGFDHGVFVPFYVAYPDADVPILQLSIKKGYDPEEHLDAGRALAPLRDREVLIVGSGFSFHNLRAMFDPRALAPSQAFDAWLGETLAASPAERTRRLVDWLDAPAARFAHPAEDHLVPLMVAVGAAEDEPAERYYHEEAFMGTVASSSFRLGQPPGEATGGSS